MAERNQKVFDRVQAELEKNSDLGSRELYEIAKRVDAAISGDTLQQFHARYVLPLRRKKGSRGGRTGARRGRPAGRKTKAVEAAAAPSRPRGRPRKSATSDRDRARAVLLRFAQDFSAAETKTEIVKVMSKLDDYVEQLFPSR